MDIRMDEQKGKILYLASIWPEENASAASNRVLQLARELKRQGYELVLGADGREKQAFQRLCQLGFHCVRMLANDVSFETFLKQFKPDVTIFDRFATEEKYSWRVRAVSPRSLRILDTIDLHFLRTAREKAMQEQQTMTQEEADRLVLDEDLVTRELAAIYRSDLSLLVSDAERQLLSDLCGVPPDLTMVCRLSYPLPPPFLAFSERKDYAMIGNFKHRPNEDAFFYLHSTLWPRLRERQPEAQVHIWGAHASARHMSLHNPEQGFLVHGHAADIGIALRQVRVNLAPLRFGAGIKGKIADGWWYGTPVVTTAIGAEGMYEDMTFGGSVVATPESFVEAALSLYHDSVAWGHASESGRKILAQLYRTEDTSELFVKRMELLRVEYLSQRLMNFTGRILWAQSMRASEYFSRWVEEKKNRSPQPG